VPWARARRQPDLHGAASRSAALERVRVALAAEPGEAPLVGRGWDASGWEAGPHRDALDDLAPNRAVLLHSHDFHSMWVNTAALRLAGISRATPDTPGGVFERDAAGEPTGVARENAVREFAALEKQAGPAVTSKLLDEAASTLHAAGITAVHDFQRSDEDFARMRALATRRRLRVLQHFGPEQMATLATARRRSGSGGSWFRIGALKLFADGTLGSRTAALLAPWDDAPGSGMEVVAPDELARLVRWAAELRMSVAIHAIGDRAVRNAIESAGAGMSAREASLPPRIEHVQLLDPADLGRFSALGVFASLQPQHCVTDIDAARAAWGTRCERSYAWRSLLASGARLAFGSDAPVEPPSPWLGLHAAITRTRPDGTPPGGFFPEQRLALDEALAAYTEGAAAAAGLAGKLGTLEPGAEADVVVWDRDLSSAPAAGILAARPAATVLAGQVVFLSPQAASVTDFSVAPAGETPPA
jgi:predicted amidohydrolase YtcJ